MTINKIIELGLESKAKELKEQNKSVRDIADVLTDVANQKITYSTVQRYFTAQARQHHDLIEKKENLQAKVVEAEIDTITRRNKIFERLERIADKAEKEGIDERIIKALKVQIELLDSLDKRLGRFKEPGLNVNVGVVIVDNIPQEK